MSEEPVAYLNTYSDGSTNITRENITFKLANPSKPLYLKEQIQPKVKMTSDEFGEFNKFFKYRKDTTIDNMLKFIAGSHGDGETDNLYKRFYETGTLEGSIKAQAEFAVLWAVFNPDNLEETIEIVENKKWFVRSKEQYEPDMDKGISESGYLYLTQGNIYSIEYYDVTTFKDEAQQFNTKEQAEKWTNPLTEAVQLPVEGE